MHCIIHAITGCNTVSFMWGIEKAVALSTLGKDTGLHLLGSGKYMNELIAEATECVATCYGCNEKSHKSHVRYQVWLRKTACKNAFSDVKLKSLPPTREAFEQHVKCAHISKLLCRKGALEPDPHPLDPTLYGWCKNDTSRALELVTVPDDTEPASQVILKMISCGC